MFRRLANLFGRPMAPRSPAAERESLTREHAQHLLASETMEAAELLRLHPPKIEHAKKKVLFEIALARGLQGRIAVYRYGGFRLPSSYEPYDPATKVVTHAGYFRYAASDAADDWFLNFAHHNLFHSYGQFMFAQDEIQVAEHPALACLREMMLCRSDRLRPFVVEHGEPTPVLVRGAERTLQIDTRTIYGERFARADESAIRQAAKIVDPPMRSNILAIEAPIPTGNATYRLAEIEAALATAYAGFRAAVLNACAAGDAAPPVAIHTGNWGCGAYGGNRQVMLSVQLLAARLAGVAKLVIYCGTESQDDVTTFDSALTTRFGFKPSARIDSVIDRMVAAAFPWGKPDGN